MAQNQDDDVVGGILLVLLVEEGDGDEVDDDDDDGDVDGFLVAVLSVLFAAGKNSLDVVVVLDDLGGTLVLL